MKFLPVAGRGQRRARIIFAAERFELIYASRTRDAKSPLDLCVVRLEFGIGDRPINQSCPRNVADDRA